MGDFPSESLFVIVFLLISFLSWIAEKVKAARQDRPPSQPQQRYDGEPADFGPTPSRRPQQKQPGQEGTASMRDILESLGIPVEPEPEPTPPPLPEPEPERVPVATQVIAEPRQAEVHDPHHRMSDAQDVALQHLEDEEQAFAPKRNEVSHSVKTARRLLQPKNLQAAFILKEVLDRPKSLD